MASLIFEESELKLSVTPYLWFSQIPCNEKSIQSKNEKITQIVNVFLTFERKVSQVWLGSRTVKT